MKNSSRKTMPYLRAAVVALALGLAGCGEVPPVADLSRPESEPGDLTAALEPEMPAPAVTIQAYPILSPDEAGLAENPDSIVALVNKNSRLAADYAPPDLEYVDIPFSFSEKIDKRKLRREAAAALADLVAAAEAQGLSIYGVSGYRSYNSQASIFEYNIGRFGSADEANRISARPGESEHQTGLVMDVSTAAIEYALEQSFDRTPEYAFIRDNAHRYGFVVRYPQGKEDITGYMYEPWHLRYFGPELAAALYEAGQTYEEYLAAWAEPVVP